MANVSVIGCGIMGSALAKTFLDSGNRVFVWNRSKEKCQPLVTKGATCSDTAVETATAAEVMVLCLSDYTVSTIFLETNDLWANLSGKTLVQLSSGTPQEARTLEKKAKGYNVTYLDGAIMAYPPQIGTIDAMILFSGSSEAYDRYSETLKCLAGNIPLVSKEVGGAATLDCALLVAIFGAMWGYIEGLGICHSENFSLKQFDESMSTYLPVMGETFKDHYKRISSGNYNDTVAPIQTWANALNHIIDLARDSDLDTSTMDGIKSLLNRAITAGYGNQDMAALFEVVKKAR